MLLEQSHNNPGLRPRPPIYNQMFDAATAIQNTFRRDRDEGKTLKRRSAKVLSALHTERLPTSPAESVAALKPVRNDSHIPKSSTP